MEEYSTYFNPRLLTENDSNLQEENQKCDLLGTFSFLVQMILGFLAFTVLINTVINQEDPGKFGSLYKILIKFQKDVSKQIISACTVHILNLLIAIFLSISIETTADQCIWYFLNLLVDSTIGVLLCYGMMILVDKIANKYNLKYLKSGLYFEKKLNRRGKLVNKLKLKMYFSQLFIWVIVAVIAKFLLLGFSKLFFTILEQIGNFFLKPFIINEKIELIMVMIIFPLIFNAIQFWVLDNILKHPYEAVQNTNQADIHVSQMKDVNQFRTSEGFLGNVELNFVKASDYVPPKDIEIPKDDKINIESMKNKDDLDTCSNSSSNTNDVKINAEPNNDKIRNNIL